MPRIPRNHPDRPGPPRPRSRAEGDLPFENLTAAAELATFGVEHLMRTDQPEIAAILQPVAYRAWGACGDQTQIAQLIADAQDALERLQAFCHQRAVRMFLTDLISQARGALGAGAGEGSGTPPPDPRQLTLFDPDNPTTKERS